MFSKGSKPTSPTPSAPPPSPRADDMSKSKSSGVPSIISADLKITGDLRSSGDIQIDGAIEGDISSRTLTVGEGADVAGSISADSVRICGAVSGQVKATTVVLAKTAKVTGDIIHESVAIEAGAYVEGNIRRLESVKSTAEPKVSVVKPAAEVASHDTSSPSPPEVKPVAG